MTPDEGPTTTGDGMASTEMIQENLEKWLLSTAREHMLKDPSLEDNRPGIPVIQEPKTANVTY